MKQIKYEAVVTVDGVEYREPITPPKLWRGYYWRVPKLVRFFSKIEFTENCWLWRGVVTNSGYGLMGSGGGGMRTVHRFAFEFFKGPVPRGSVICHTCDVRICVNPIHLFSGSRSDNMQDATQKHRLRGPVKLTDDQVRSIRLDYAAGNVSMDALAKKHHIAVVAIWKIVRMKSHLWITPTEQEKKCIQQRICRKVTSAALETVRRRYLAGERPNDLAKAYGITATRVVQIGKHGH